MIKAALTGARKQQTHHPHASSVTSCRYQHTSSMSNLALGEFPLHSEERKKKKAHKCWFVAKPIVIVTAIFLFLVHQMMILYVVGEER